MRIPTATMIVMDVCAINIATGCANKGYSPWDADPLRHERVLDFGMERLRGYTHPVMNTGTGDCIGAWPGRLNYDPLHSDLNTFKVLFNVITDMHIILGIKTHFAWWLSGSPIKMEMLNVGKADKTVDKIRAEFGDSVREKHGELLGKEKTVLLNAHTTLTVAGVEYESVLFLETLSEFAETKGPTRDLARRMFRVAHQLTDLFHQASKIILNHTRRFDGSVEAKALVDEYYKLMHDEICEKLQMDLWETYFKWPNHHKAEHLANDMHGCFQLAGLPYGRGTCGVQEALTQFWIEEFKHTNGHTSVDNIDDVIMTTLSNRSRTNCYSFSRFD